MLVSTLNGASQHLQLSGTEGGAPASEAVAAGMLPAILEKTCLNQDRPAAQLNHSEDTVVDATGMSVLVDVLWFRRE